MNFLALSYSVQLGAMDHLEHAMQRHADFYIDALMNWEKNSPELDIEEKRRELYLDFGQIITAVNRVFEEEVGSNYHPSLIRLRYCGVYNQFMSHYLGALENRNISTSTELSCVELAINLIIKTNTKDIYGVDIKDLYSSLNEERERLGKLPKDLSDTLDWMNTLGKLNNEDLEI